MSRASRQEKAKKKLQALELEFEQLLRGALRSCAGGRWGLLGQYPEQYRLKEAEQLETLGREIGSLRQELGIVDEFWHYSRFIHYRSIQGSNALGEPKLAKGFLEEIEHEPLGQPNNFIPSSSMLDE
jgi:hypothetical protein